MQALVEAQPTMEGTVTSVLWSIMIVVPLEQLRAFASTHSQPDFVEQTRTRLGILLKTCELQSLDPHVSDAGTLTHSTTQSSRKSGKQATLPHTRRAVRPKSKR